MGRAYARPVDSTGGGEWAAIGRIRSRFPAPPPGETWIGDDAAVVEVAGHALLLAADVVVAGTHVDLALTSIADMGWKAVAVNVSDIAAMGGRPLHLTVTVVGPPEIDLDGLYDGIAEASRHYGCPVVGGDLAIGPGPSVSVAITGWSPERRPVLRAGARPGDGLWCTGPLGRASAGLSDLRAGRASSANAAAHRRPRARVEEGTAAARAGATAMTDVSDGLASDLHHLVQASATGAALDRVPVAEGCTTEQALGGGEDYELVFAAPDPDRVRAEFAAAGLATPLLIGRCVPAADGLTLAGQPLAPLGWEHRWRGASRG